MKSILRSMLVMGTVAGLVVGCGDDDPDDGIEPDPGPFSLTFEGDATFQGPHGGQAISVALIRDSDGAVVARDDGTVSTATDPAFSFTFPDVLESGETYRLAYWIDSNFGGTAGVCEPLDVDHQWELQITDVTEDVTLSENHDPTTRAPVCDVFSGSLTFEGDATFQGAHGGQDVRVAILDEDGAVVGRAEGAVSASSDPAFSFAFDGLPLGGSYRAHYWIDSNFGGGGAGVCDDPDTDHQWDVSLGTMEADLTRTEEHRPGDTADVCGTFAAQVTFEGDATFQGAHGGQDITAVIVDADGAVVARAGGTVATSGETSFSLTFPGLVVGQAYRIHYWIDSNFGGGTVGVCDGPGTDHQWDVSLGTLEEDVTRTEDHRPGETTDVCGSFSADLTFGGDATFGGAHGGQTVTVAVVDGQGRIVGQAAGAVSGSDDPAFSFDFPGALVVGRSYTVDYWIDSNFGGGTVGVCDPPGNDHQWRVDLGSVTGGVSRIEEHAPGDVMDVCDTFD